MPKFENSIWPQLTARTRARDAKLQTTQQILLAAIKYQLEVINGLIGEFQSFEEIVDVCLGWVDLVLDCQL